ncbi:MAG: ATP-dependent Clp protease proteolytic subunit [Balneolaceae bacterium]|nr:ATP-dependent Clp protease proteolytic subunit [Balneolaceae bacterium]
MSKKKSTTEQDAKKKDSEGINEKKENDIDLEKFENLLNLIANIPEDKVNDLRPLLYKQILKITKRHEISSEYLILFLYEPNNRISEGMVDRIYNAISTDNEKPILMIIHNHGGRIEPAYLISKTCKELSKKFVVAVPRKAKSAATLIALGGQEIHMGPMSELGPIDPQFGGLPALGISSSLESIAKIVSKYPNSSNMFSEFMKEKLDLRILGYFERVSESAVQYATRLLSEKDQKINISEIAHKLVYEYKDHSFVIDKEEATKLLGDCIKDTSPEYILSNDIHSFLNNVNMCLEVFHKKSLAIIGSNRDFSISSKKQEED